MRDSQHDGQTDREGDGVSLLAKTVMARLAARDAASDRRLVESMVQLLTEAMIEPDPAAFDALRPLLRKMRVASTDLADHYFPEIARRLGCDWAEDRRSFVDVSIGVARMQAVLRDIGAEWSSGEGERPRVGEVLVILPEGEQHSFGAMVLTGQLRRRGVSVRLMLGPGDADLRQLLGRKRYDGVLISVATLEKLEPCRALVARVKDCTRGRIRVALGGAVLFGDGDAPTKTGADIVTNDVQKALAALGLGVAGVRVDG